MGGSLRKKKILALELYSSFHIIELHYVEYLTPLILEDSITLLI